MSPTNLDYDARCARATTAQGLDPVVKALTDAGIPVHVWQTGGFCMVAAVRDEQGTGVIVITGDVGAYWYPDDDLQEDCAEIACAPSGGVYETAEQLADLVARITAFRASGAKGYSVKLCTQALTTPLSTHEEFKDALLAAEAARRTHWQDGFPIVAAVLS
jgi:hypothetical protein